jgi:hypothetical protein
MLAALSSASALERLRIFARRDLRAFPGLAPGTTLDDIAAVFNLDRSWHGQEILGSERRRTDWFSAAAAGFARGIRVCADDDDVVLLDVPYAELPNRSTPMLETLGEPDARLDSYLGTFEIERSEYVYARRGLTLYINPANGVLFRIAAFVPTELETYQRSLRLDLKITLLPRPDFEVKP